MKHIICLLSIWVLIPTATTTGSIQPDAILIFPFRITKIKFWALPNELELQ